MKILNWHFNLKSKAEIKSGALVIFVVVLCYLAIRSAFFHSPEGWVGITLVWLNRAFIFYFLIFDSLISIYKTPKDE